jgi:hypothetical protein
VYVSCWPSTAASARSAASVEREQELLDVAALRVAAADRDRRDRRSVQSSGRERTSHCASWSLTSAESGRACAHCVPLGVTDY